VSTQGKQIDFKIFLNWAYRAFHNQTMAAFVEREYFISSFRAYFGSIPAGAKFLNDERRLSVIIHLFNIHQQT
jgi:hypothetical protein